MTITFASASNESIATTSSFEIFSFASIVQYQFLMCRALFHILALITNSIQSIPVAPRLLKLPIIIPRFSFLSRSCPKIDRSPRNSY